MVGSGESFRLQEALASLGFNPGDAREVEPLRLKRDHGVYRLALGGRRVVLKAFDGVPAGEVLAYRLLRDLGITTLPVLAESGSALLLEDLGQSHAWRAAKEEDVSEAEVGEAVARWYLAFHDAGEKLAAGKELPAFLEAEYDALTPESLAATGERLGLGDERCWQLAVAHIYDLRALFESMAHTILYNDFYWTNLALSREGPLRAVVFDYNLLGSGMRYSDWRNVTGSLAGAAREAFTSTYGPTDPREMIIDGPLSTLYCLQVASAGAELPAWATGSLQEAGDGTLERMLDEALALS